MNVRNRLLLLWGFLGIIVVGGSLIEGPMRPSASADDRADQAKAAASRAEAKPTRTRSGLLALYDFRSSSGPTVEDRSGVGKPVNLKIADMKAVRRSEGSLKVVGETTIRSGEPAAKIIETVRKSGEITIEAWIRPAKTDQSGPARIVTLSRNSTERNFTLGQEQDRYDVRFWTTETSSNGLPSLSTKEKSLTPKLTHVVYSRDRTGRTRIYLNGKQHLEENVAGATLNWHGSFQLGLANEINKGRPWLGTYRLVAIYGRDLLAREVEQNFKAGPDAETPPLLARATLASEVSPFDAHVAPLLVNHCFECHDTSSMEGGLDLSRKEMALAGGDSGKAIVPGKPDKSLLWDLVAADDMPQDRPPLSDKDKELLKQWIEDGAEWPVDVIDPTFYAPGEKAVNWVRRLTVPEYIASVKAAVGVDIAQEARELLPPDLRADGFTNTAYNLSIDLGHIEAYAKLAEIIVGKMEIPKYAARFSKSRLLSTDDTMRQFVADMGKWILRGPLDDLEVNSYSGVATTVASAGGDYDEAVRFIVEAMLQSPRFLYRIENQRGDGTAWPVGDYELASRLSYIIWGSPPDAALMKAAEAGELYDRTGVEAQVRRMLKDPQAVDRSLQFVSQWLDLDRLDNLRPNSDHFPDWNPQLAADMREETRAFFKDVVWEQKRPLADLLNAQVTYVTPRLAKHYGLKPQGKGLKRYDLEPVSSRGGLLTQGSVLTIGGDEASMVTRGLFVLRDLLRGSVQDPPPCVDTTPVPTKPGLTQREIAEARIADSSCGGCHSKFEPLAFGLEKFDGLGTFHDKDKHGNQLRDDGQILFPGTGESVRYESAADMMDLLAGSPRVQQALTWKVAQFALGRPMTVADAGILEEIHESAQQAGGTYADLIRAVVLSDLVLKTQTEMSE